MPEPFAPVRGAAAPLLRPNIDTDTISPGSRPAARATAAPATGFSERGSATLAADLFAGWRYDESGAEIASFVLNRTEFRHAKILLAGANFGCGSSRESAVWMLKEWGLRCIVAPSFGEIFYGSCFKNGILPVQLDEATVERLAAEAEAGEPAALFDVDLEHDTIRTPSGESVRIELPKLRRDALLRGLDDIEQTLARDAEIARFEARASEAYPWIYAPEHAR
jgi:3-isopropylmalate/(R)-2-methylmalate dehydratase small subunit